MHTLELRPWLELKKLHWELFQTAQRLAEAETDATSSTFQSAGPLRHELIAFIYRWLRTINEATIPT